MVPAIRTIPGVEIFDYTVPESNVPAIGDLLRVPFRQRFVPAMVVAVSSSSAFAQKAVHIEKSPPLLSLGAACADLLDASASHAFVSKPSVLASWIRTVPKRAAPLIPVSRTSMQSELPAGATRYLVDRWAEKNGLLNEIHRHTGRILVLTPWQHRADILAHALNTAALHSDIPTGKAWKTIHGFVSDESRVLIATRIGAWLSCIADTVLIDEPENDDHKQDELSPRLDARWVVSQCARLRPSMSLITFGTTPRLTKNPQEAPRTPTINGPLTIEPWKKRGGSLIEMVSPNAFRLAQEAVSDGRSVFIIHPVSGDRARLACRDCGWTAICVFCAFHLSSIGASALCKRCGRKAIAPESCKTCGGTDFSRGLPGKSRLMEQCAAAFPSSHVRAIDPLEYDQLTLSGDDPKNHLAIVTDLGLLAGAAEDIRRKERLLIAWRRVAASAASGGGQLYVQASDELAAECRSWLTAEGVFAAWKTEQDERRAFGYPPAVPFAKLLVDGAERDAKNLFDEIGRAIPSTWHLNGPFPVSHRSYTRVPRHVLHLVAAEGVTESEMQTILEPYKKRAFIDLDPIAFFS